MRAVLRVAAVLVALAVVGVVAVVARPDRPATGPAAPPAVPSDAQAAFPATVPVGADLPSGDECAELLPRDGFEPRPENTTANYTAPPGIEVPEWTDYGYAPEFNERIVPRIAGGYTGATDDILRWGACKWGLHPDLVRAMAVEESSWRQSAAGDVSRDDADCVTGQRAPCPTSFGILQVKHIYRPGSYPLAARSTSFNVDYALGTIRGCYEGWVEYLDNGYRAGDLWGCVGWHFSGEWRDPAALRYVQRVQSSLERAPWLRW